jgi:glycosyltransferase involved in cell wall biosynthesis
LLSSERKVVILLATRNGAGFIREQLESFRIQTHSNWELLVSDDGSTDGTVELIENFAARVPQRVTILPGPRQGFWQNFLSLVRAEQLTADRDDVLFAYSDQDDVWNAEKLGRAVAWLGAAANQIPALYFSRTELIEEDGEPAGLSPLFKRRPCFRNALVQNIGGGNTMVFNRAALAVLRSTAADTQMVSHDWWTYQVITGVGGVSHYDPWPSLKYRQHAQNLVGSNAGFRARYVRLRAFANGRVVQWNDVNIKSLNGLRRSLTEDNARVLECFSRARQGPVAMRILQLWKSGVYRQSALETLGLYIAALFGRL